MYRENPILRPDALGRHKLLRFSVKFVPAPPREKQTRSELLVTNQSRQWKWPLRSFVRFLPNVYYCERWAVGSWERNATCFRLSLLSGRLLSQWLPFPDPG